MGKKAQVSIEYLLITAFAFMFTVPVIALFYSQSHQINEDITAAQTDRIAEEIVNSVNEVYYMGEPSKKTVTVYMPSSVQSVTLRDNKLIMNVSSSAGDYQVVKWADANMTGTIEDFEGIHKIEVKAGFNEVEVSD